MNPIKPKFDPPVFDLCEELLKYQELHPEEDNYMQKSPKVLSDYFKAPPKPVLERSKSPKTVKGNDYMSEHKIEAIQEQKRDKDIGIYIAEIKPLIKNSWQRCVLL